MLAKHQIFVFLSFFLIQCTPRYQNPEANLVIEEPASSDIVNDLTNYSEEKEAHISEPDPQVIDKQEDIDLNSALNLADHEQKKEVQKWIRYFSEKDHARFQRFLDRGQKYRRMIKSILTRQEVPTYLFYLAMIESGFSTHVKSRASAVGVWQFIAPTARRYGLRVDSVVDERRDPIRATLAASEYLKDLHRVFQSWPLAMAGYNAGEMRIVSSIMRQGSRDFWELARKKKLPPETRNYIPKFIAAAIIGHEPEKYGFKIDHSIDMPALKAVAFPAPAKISQIARISGLSVRQLKIYNPNFKGPYTPATKKYRVWLPETIKLTKKQIASIDRVRGAKRLYAGHSRYKVRRGDSLYRVARKFGISLATLKRNNRLRSNRIYPGQVLKIPGKGSTARHVAHKRRYRVRKGDNLIKISKKFGVSVPRLKRLNAIKSSRIYVGQVIKVSS